MTAESHLDLYRRWNQLSKLYIRWQFAQFRPDIGRHVADVGCGLGDFTELLADRDFYLGIDLDMELLEELQRVHGQRSNVLTARLDITKPELKESLQAKKVDTVLCVRGGARRARQPCRAHYGGSDTIERTRVLIDANAPLLVRNTG